MHSRTTPTMRSPMTVVPTIRMATNTRIPTTGITRMPSHRTPSRTMVTPATLAQA